MNHLTLGDLLLGLNDLFVNRHANLKKSRIGQVYEEELSEHRATLSALPPEYTSAPRPLTKRLQDKDDEHDGCIRVLWYTTQATLDDPFAPPELKAAALEIRERLGLSLQDTRPTLSEEIQTAQARKARIEELRPKLELFPLPGGRTLYTVAQAYLTAAAELDALLSERATLEAMSEEDRRRLKTLRPEIIGLLGRLRRAMGDEIRRDATLPRNLDALVFGYLDELHRTSAEAHDREQEAKARAKSAAKAEAALTAKLKAAEAEVQAGVKAREAEVARQRAEAAKAEAEEKASEAEQP